LMRKKRGWIMPGLCGLLEDERAAASSMKRYARER
jgi:hypothetical protein